MLTELMSKDYMVSVRSTNKWRGNRCFIKRCVLPWNKGKSTSAVPAYIFLGVFDFRQAQKDSTGVGTRIGLRLLSRFIDRTWKPILTCDVKAQLHPRKDPAGLPQSGIVTRQAAPFTLGQIEPRSPFLLCVRPAPSNRAVPSFSRG